MILRQTLNFAGHFMTGVALGALAVAAANAQRQGQNVGATTKTGKEKKISGKAD